MKKKLILLVTLLVMVLIKTMMIAIRASVPLYDLSIHTIPSTQNALGVFETIPRLLLIIDFVLLIGCTVYAWILYRKRILVFRVIALWKVLIITTLVLFGFFYYKNITREQMIKVQGFLTDPMTGQSYSGVDARVGTTTLHIGEGGALAFDLVGTRHGISLTHKDLHRKIILLPQAFSSKEGSIYFSAPLMNALVDVIDMEARGKYDRIYQQLPKEIKDSVDEHSYITSYTPIFTLDDLSQQEIVIASITYNPEVALRSGMGRLHDVYEIIVYQKYHQVTYRATLDSNQIWHIAN